MSHTVMSEDRECRILVVSASLEIKPRAAGQTYVSAVP